MKQETSGGRRRWFQAEGLDLVVWFDSAVPEEIVGFQLCYDVRQAKYALTWRRTRGVTHSLIDTGDTSPLRNETPVLNPDPLVPSPAVRARVAGHSVSLDKPLRSLVLNVLAGHPESDGSR